MAPGDQDIDVAVAALADRLPEPLAPLARVAYNYRWSWTPGGAATFAALDPDRWERSSANPVVLGFAVGGVGVDLAGLALPRFAAKFHVEPVASH